MSILTIAPSDLDAAMMFCRELASAQHEIIPASYRGKPGAILAAIQHGAELGLKPMQSLSAIAVIRGKPTIYGDSIMALCRKHPECEDIEETIDNPGTDKAVARCIVHRAGCKPAERTFSVADAKRAGLWGNKGPWSSYPDRMLQMRARGFALRDVFADALAGFITTEEAQDYPEPAATAKPKRATPGEPTVITAEVLESKTAALPAKPAVSDDVLRALAHLETLEISKQSALDYLSLERIEQIEPAHLKDLRELYINTKKGEA